MQKDPRIIETYGLKNLAEPMQPEESLKDFLDNVTVGVHLVDKTGSILYANQAELDMLGYTSEEYIGQSIAKFHFDQELITEILGKLIGGKEIINQEATLLCKDGSEKHVLISSNVRWEDGKFVHTRCITRDISKQKKVEKLLRVLNKVSEELTVTLDTEQALEKISAFLVPTYADWFTIDTLNPDGSIEHIRMTHADPEKIAMAQEYRDNNPMFLSDDTTGSPSWVIRTGEPILASEVTGEMIRKAARDKEHFRILKELNLRSGMIVPMMVKGKAMGAVSFLSSSENRRYDGSDFEFAKDFANRVALTLENASLYEDAHKQIEEIAQANRNKDEFISIASHELKTPVTSLKAYTQILQMKFGEEGNVAATEMLAKMDKQVDKLTHLIIDLLDTTKIEKGELLYNLEEFKFNVLVEEIVEEMQRATITHKIKLHLQDCKKIRADKPRIGQVIINLISNAIKYSPNAHEINVYTSCSRKEVKLCVRDHGIGIPASEQSQVFNRFFRVTGKDHQNTFPGLGLGLYISSEIIKRHRGKISFESKEGAGTTFCFELQHIDID